MKELLLIEPSKKFKDEFAQMVQDYEKYGEIEYYEMYKSALDDFNKYVENLIDNSRGIGLKEGWVPCSTFWLIDNTNHILGVIRVRKELNSEFLRNIGGHIGYDIAPSNRRNGYGAHILKIGLEKVKSMGINTVLITCKSDNQASARIIEKNGGIFDSEIRDSDSSKIFRRYWINMTNE
ncbi:MAG: GNAT family N-acetyltransferase [Sedimentibacter sp.]|uniref:GNAT family N-acetyltransferase n=1 Tax=Sedimentibacter sp. TaxID=1960295 RepID=UPI00315920EE